MMFAAANFPATNMPSPKKKKPAPSWGGMSAESPCAAPKNSSDPFFSGTVGVLASGGLDSCVLIGHLLRQGGSVQPFYVRCGLIWEPEELAALQAFLKGLPATALKDLVVFDLPLADLYGSHWSIDGNGTPGAQSRDDAVYLPGRNALLAIKPAIWCIMHGLEQLALATLAGNPFADATEGFFQAFAGVLGQATDSRVAIVQPFAHLRKEEVVRLGRGLPLQQTFSCIAPRGGLHCGTCNKCAERRKAFLASRENDPTNYASEQT